MQKIEFPEAVAQIVAEDPRFHPEAYGFLREALEYTIKMRKKRGEGVGHVTGQQLLEGVRQYALKQFGPMVPTVFSTWGVTCCEDFGEMVFALVRVGVFGKTDQDSIEDFRGAYTFHEAFVAPFLPDPPKDVERPVTRGSADPIARNVN